MNVLFINSDSRQRTIVLFVAIERGSHGSGSVLIHLGCAEAVGIGALDLTPQNTRNRTIMSSVATLILMMLDRFDTNELRNCTVVSSVVL